MYSLWLWYVLQLCYPDITENLLQLIIMQVCWKDVALSHKMITLDLATLLSLRSKEMMTYISNKT